MNKKILASIFVIGMLALAMGWGTYSYFTETEQSTGNTFRAGYVDLALSTGSGYTNPWVGSLATFDNMAPGQETGDINVWFKNVGSLPGIVTVVLSYVNNDAAGEPNTVVSTDFARKVIITHVEVDDSGNNVAYYWALQVAEDPIYGTWAAAVADGAVVSVDGSYLATVYGVSKITLHFWDSYKGNDVVFGLNQAHKETLKLKLDASVGNEFMKQGIDIIMTATIRNA
jgi:predicted ribosomally synthesized peptide with SipW-like signal peptide